MDKPYSSPIKILFKAKNNNGQYQQYNYIFVGDPPKDIQTILLKIKDYDFPTTLKKLTKQELSTLADYYGELWYKYFFTYEYIENQFTKDNPYYDIIKKYINIEQFETIKSNSVYRTFGLSFLEDTNLHMISNLFGIKKSLTAKDINTNYNSYRISGLYQGGTTQKEAENSEEFSNQLDDLDDDIDINQLTEEMIEDYSKQEQKEEEYDEKQNKTDKKALDKALNINTSNKIQRNFIKFDTKYDDTIYAYSPRFTTNKYYIFNQYIYPDDTIDVIKNKICCSILNKDKYSKNGSTNYIIPSRQYLWFYDKSNNAVPLGFTWKREYALLDYQYEPVQNIKIYENLTGNIKKFYNDIVVRKSKLIREKNNNEILEQYRKYMINEDIYMVDIYNELSTKNTRTPEEINNLTQTYIKIFFPDILQEHYNNIFSYIDGSNPTPESDYINKIFNDITPNLILNDSIFNIVNNISIKKYKIISNIIKENHIIQAKIVCKLKSSDVIKFNRLDLFKIFDDFNVNNKYIFIQLNQLNKKTIYKFYAPAFNERLQNIPKEDNDTTEETPDTLSFSNDEIVSSEKYKQTLKWFSKNKPGITFKIQTDNNIITSVTINTTGDLQYKIHWKEDDQKIYSDISKSYELIKQLIRDINKTSIHNKFNIPLDHDFETMFVSTIAKFELPNNAIIDHNNLSKFSRLFYPYFALVIEPRKRISQIRELENKSKWGTYLRYKRISNYENPKKIEDQIKKYLQYYDATTPQIIDAICKQFNITNEIATNYYQNVLRMYPNATKKKAKKLMKLTDTQKYKTLGVDVAIQGKSTDKYKLRITGVKNETMSDNIINICSVLLYLYYEIYIEKNKKLFYINDILKKLNNIAERRYIVADYVDNSKRETFINASVDKYRIGFKPYKNQTYYKRMCQNSGLIRRQPQQYTDDNIDRFLELGYKKNKSSGYYEKQVILKDGRRKTLRAVELNAIDNKGNYTNSKIYYTCDPKYNGEFMYVGYLPKYKSPFGEPIPCCFKKEKINIIEQKNKKEKQRPINEQLYILQDTIKLQEGKLGKLPNILDYYLNNLHKKEIKIDKHMLISTKSEKSDNYYFKIGVDNTKNSFITSVAYCLGINYNSVLMKCINSLNGKNKDLIFNTLNNGDIKLEFHDINKYISILKKSNLNIKYIIHLLSIPGVLLDEGLNIILFQKGQSLNNIFKHDYTIKYVNNEEIDYINDNRRKTILICADNINYFPICSVIKKDNEMKLSIKYLFNKNDEIIEYIKDYYNEFNRKDILDNNFTAKSLIDILKNNKITIENQVIDTKNKVRFIATKNLLIPVEESGSIYNIPIIKKFDNYLQSLDKTLDLIKDIYSIKELIGYIPSSLQYDKIKNNKHRIRSILLNNKLYIPVNKIYIEKEKYSKYQLNKIPYYDNIDKYLLEPTKKIIDERIKIINYSKFQSESYELFKYHISEYLTDKLRNIIRNIINSELEDIDKLDILKGFFFKIINNKKLNDVYSRLKRNNKDDLLKDAYDIHKFYIYDDTKIPNLDEYTKENVRKLCNSKSKDKCNYHCMWANDLCVFSLSYKTAILFINKLSQEILNNPIKRKEILKEDNYYVSSVINENYYTERKNQKVLVKQANQKENPFVRYYQSQMPYLTKLNDIINEPEPDDKNETNEIKSFSNKYVQKIKSDSNAFIKAYANGMNWIINKKQKIENRNLGYSCMKQEKIANYIKGLIVDYIMDYSHKDEFKNINTHEFIVNLIKDSNDINNIKKLIEILYNIHKIPIIVYNEYDIVIYRTDKEIIPGKNTINIKIGADNEYFVIYY